MKTIGRIAVVALLLVSAPLFCAFAADESDVSAPKYPDPSLSGPPIAFFANLSADEESSVTDSSGKGRADFILDRATLRFSWKVTFDKLTSLPAGAHIHGPQTPGGEAGVLIDLAPNGVKSPLEGSVILTDGQLRYLLTDRMYLNITTAKYKQGELRGQVQRVRPKVTQ